MIKDWTKEEILYATSIADLFALAIETAEKDKIFNTLLDSERNFNFALTLWTLFLILTMIGFGVFLYKFFNRKSSKR